jgi:short-subunit dehydrogenase
MPVATSSPRVLVTGASSGIGAALALELARRGHQLWLAAPPSALPELTAVVDHITAAGRHARAVVLDVSDARACADTVAKLDDDVAGFDVVIANAGIGGRNTVVWTIDIDDASELVATNLTGALATILPLLPRMRARRRGHVVGVSSMTADIRQPVGAVYSATKAALSHFLDSIAVELEAHGVAVTVVHAGFVRTAMTEGKGFSRPFLVEVDDAARTIADAVAARRRWLRFPLGLRLLTQAMRLLPRRWRAQIVNRNNGLVRLGANT